MAKGFLKGALSGAGFGLASLALMSVLQDDAGHNNFSAKLGLTGRDEDRAESGQDRASASGPSGAGLMIHESPAPQPDTLAGLLPEMLSPGGVPQAGVASDLKPAETPATDAMNGIAEPSSQAPDVSFSDTATLQTPEIEPGVSVSTDPAQPVASKAQSSSAAFGQSLENDEQYAAELTSKSNRATVSSDLSDAVPQSPPISAEPDQPVAPDISLESGAFSAAQLEATHIDEPEVSAEVDEAISVPQPEKSAISQSPADGKLSNVAPVAMDAPTQPVQKDFIVERIAAVVPEAAAPDHSTVKDLPAPDPASQSTEQGESTSAQVVASVSVELPAPGPALDANTAVEAKIGPAPTVPSSQTLPRVANEMPVAMDVAQTAPALAALIAPEAAVRVNRLPALGQEEDATEAALAAPEGAGDEEVVPDLPPVERFAAVFDNPESKPLVGVVLVDTGVGLQPDDAGLERLQSVSYPVSIAVDALLPDAAIRMQRYRSIGIEVMASVDLPTGATAVDAETSLSVTLGKMSEIVGVLDGVQTGVQTTADAGRQVAQILSHSGHGLVTRNKSLNTVQKLAVREGVPSAVIYRDIDGQSPAGVRRSLDQAAFRAGQQGSVVIVGRLQEDTLSALTLWTQQNRASMVVVSPVSAVLEAQ